MSKKKRKYMPRGNTADTGSTKSTSGDIVTGPSYPTEEIKWWREAIEGLVVAIVLALLIRGFEAEAFVIPTGSMASTLRGRHKDIRCEECNKEYAVGSSLESEHMYGDVVTSICPICATPQEIRYDKGRDASFAGDRILVNKFAYDPLGKPERFDVIVFKNPNDAKQNYIKRLCGLPGESLLIHRGDIFVRPLTETTGKYSIARKPPRKMRALLQIVDDTAHVSPTLQAAGMPARWQPYSGDSWSPNATSQQFTLTASDTESWIRYRNFIPSFDQWQQLKLNKPVELSGMRPSLISDAYAYNSYLTSKATFPDRPTPRGQSSTFNFFDRMRGKNWVGDLAVEAEVKVASDAGRLLLDLVEGGWHFRCEIDVSNGQATLSIKQPDGQPGSFLESSTATADTSVRGKGKYDIVYSNVDSEVRLWVNDKLVSFNEATSYSRDPNVNEFDIPLRPYYGGPSDPGDAAPLGIGGVGLQAEVGRIKVHRDVYYVAEDRQHQDPSLGDYNVSAPHEKIDAVFTSPESWENEELFDQMQVARFELKDFDNDALDQFFPMGDNSPHSLDARLWKDHFVERQLLIGEAVFIYYPHPWRVKLPGSGFKTVPLVFYPKFSRMGVIR